MREHGLRDAGAARALAHEHPLHFSETIEERKAATADRAAVAAGDEKLYVRFEERIQREAMHLLGRICDREFAIEFVDQRAHVIRDAVRPFDRNLGHQSRPPAHNEFLMTGIFSSTARTPSDKRLGLRPRTHAKKQASGENHTDSGVQDDALFWKQQSRIPAAALNGVPMSTDENNETPLSDDDLDDVSGGFAKPPVPERTRRHVHQPAAPPAEPPRRHQNLTFAPSARLRYCRSRVDA